MFTTRYSAFLYEALLQLSETDLSISSSSKITEEAVLDILTKIESELALKITEEIALELLAAKYCWGDDGGTEYPQSWTTWKTSGGGAITVTGDSNYGKMVMQSGDINVSNVVHIAEAGNKTFTLTKNKYGTGSGEPNLFIRGATTSFLWDAGSPSWQAYTGAISGSDWAYVQIKVET